MNKSKREFYVNIAVASGNTKIVWQATSGRKLSEDGSPLPIHGKIISSLMNPATKRPLRGSFKDKLSQNGNRLVRVLFYGSTGNVSAAQPLCFRRD